MKRFLKTVGIFLIVCVVLFIALTVIIGVAAGRQQARYDAADEAPSPSVSEPESESEPEPEPAPEPEPDTRWWMTNRSPTATSVQWRRFTDADKLAVAGIWVKTYQGDGFTSYDDIRDEAEELVTCADEAIRDLDGVQEMHVIAGVCLLVMYPK